MEIKFLKDCFIEICVGFDEDDEPIMEEEKMEADEKFDVELISTQDDEFVQIQFEDGEVAFVQRSLFEII
jgi:hypothetical protein